MNQTRWLIVVLIVSWTLNVALGVALYLRSTEGYRTCEMNERERFAPGQPPPQDPQALMSLRRQFGQRFQERTTPIRQDYRQLMISFSEMFSEDSLDTLNLFQLVDSIAIIRGELLKELITSLTNIHPDLTMNERRRLCRQIAGQMELGPPHQRPETTRRRHKRPFPNNTP
ncbi:MAG: hypothetical protein P9M15_02605 [Candidatus Electryoneaceae bacterium]|nr:hypothetical protein [Candidatus Electryoneaceae bacterium]